MELFAGTSGFSYKAWKGPFYPEDLRADAMLRYYGERLRAVEINNTFYRMPGAGMLGKWAAQVPAGFRFVLKAPQRITHRARLQEVEEPVAQLWERAGELGAHAGPVLYQLPPNLRCDVGRLRGFLAALPTGMRAAFEFRHASWATDEVYEALRAGGAALCAADVDDAPEPAIVPTAGWGYLRLRRSDYDEAALGAWAERIRAQPWGEAFAFFKHEDEGFAPKMALQLTARFAP